MRYITRDGMFERLRECSAELIAADERMDAEIRRREIDIQRSRASDPAKRYAMGLLQKLSFHREQMSKAHYAQQAVVEASSVLCKYMDEMERLNERYGSMIDTFDSLDMGKVLEIEGAEIERTKRWKSSFETLLDGLPRFEDLERREMIA